MKNHLLPGFLAGMLCGAVIFGGGVAYASGILASPSTHSVTVDGSQVAVEAYTINGNNYFKLRDIAALVDFGVTWNNATRTVEIDTAAPYEKPEPVAEQPASDAEGSSTLVDMYAIREEIVQLTNGLRQESGLPALTMDDDLMAAAQVRAEEAAATITYSHTRPDGSDNDTVLTHTGTLLMGENMGMKDLVGTSEAALADLQVQSWTQSPGHCRNMLNTIYHSMGAGIAKDQYGMYYIVQIFAGGDYTITGVDVPVLKK